MKQTIEIGTHTLELQAPKFIKSMGVKRIFEPIMLDIYSTEGLDDERVTNASLRKNFYDLTETQFNDIVKAFTVYITKIDKKTKITEEVVDELLSNSDVVEIIYMIQLIFNGLVPDSDKKK